MWNMNDFSIYTWNLKSGKYRKINKKSEIENCEYTLGSKSHFDFGFLGRQSLINNLKAFTWDHQTQISKLSIIITVHFKCGVFVFRKPNLGIINTIIEIVLCTCIIDRDLRLVFCVYQFDFQLQMLTKILDSLQVLANRV